MAGHDPVQLEAKVPPSWSTRLIAGQLSEFECVARHWPVKDVIGGGDWAEDSVCFSVITRRHPQRHACRDPAAGSRLSLRARPRAGWARIPPSSSASMSRGRPSRSRGTSGRVRRDAVPVAEVVRRSSIAAVAQRCSSNPLGRIRALDQAADVRLNCDKARTRLGLDRPC